MRGRPRKQLLAQMRVSAGESEVLLRAYDRVIDDMTPYDAFDQSVINRLTGKRNRLDSDLRRLRGEIAMLESKGPRR